MEFTEAAKANAAKFLQEAAGSVLPKDEELPVRPNWAPGVGSVSECEVEAECLDTARNYLARKYKWRDFCLSAVLRGCPGILSYYISAEAYRQLSQSGRLEKCKVQQDGESKATDLTGRLLVRELLSVVHSVCQQWSNDLPLLKAPEGKVELSLFGIKNSRRKMEDKHALCVDLNSLYGFKDCPSQAFYAVFDGHIGVEAAAYASVHLLTNVARHPAFLSDPETAIKEGFKITDERFCEKGIRSGSTAVAALIRGKKLFVGWLGDSQAMLFRKGKAVSLMEPHKPDREDEQERIEAAGGMVIWMGAWRVNGNLSVSRAIGDAPDKKFVIGDADVTSLELDGTEDYLVVACDGVWDVLNGEEVSECVYKHMSGGGSKQTVAKAIIEFARSEGSGDNMTVIVVFFSSFELVQPASVASEHPGQENSTTGSSTSA